MKRRTLVRLLGGLGLGSIALLSGCATTPADRRVFAGRFALSVSAPGKTENQTGRFRLTVRELGDAAPDLRLDLLTPLAGVLARIDVDASGAKLSRGIENTVAEGKDLDELLLNVLGFTLPVQELFDVLTAPTGSDRLTTGEWEARIRARRPEGSARTVRFLRLSGSPRITLTVTLDD